MIRPGFVLQVDDRTPPLLSAASDYLGLARLPKGASVLYPADGEPSRDRVELIRVGLESMVEGGSLAAKLRPDMKLTIVFSDCTQPAVPMNYDVRQAIIERICELAAHIGVDDVVLVAATGVRRKMTDAECAAILGDRVCQSFLPGGRLISHDCEAPGVEIGQIDGVPIVLNRRVAESDLVISVSVAEHSPGECQLATSAVSADVAAALANPHVGVTAAEVSRLIYDHVHVVAASAVLGQPVLPASLSFLSQREWEWKVADRVNFWWAKRILNALPRTGSSRVFGNLNAEYALGDFVVGDPELVAPQVDRIWHQIRAVSEMPTADVVVSGVWTSGIGSVDGVGSPLAAAHRAIAAADPVGSGALREDGVLVVRHPLRTSVSNRMHPAEADLFAEVLPNTLSATEIQAEYEPRYRRDDWYLQLYADGHASHPLHTLRQWYDIADAKQYMHDVIWIGADRANAEAMGDRVGTRLSDALEIAATHTGRNPKITFVHPSWTGRIVAQ